MPKAAVFRRGTSLPDSDANELATQWGVANQGWVLNFNTVTIVSGAVATAYAVIPVLQVVSGGASASVNKFYILSTGAIVQQATSTSGGFTGINIATGAFAVVAAYRTVAGTLAVVAGSTGATLGAAGLPVVPATAIQYGLMVIGGGATAFTGGTTALDATNAATAFFDITGPMGMCVSTGPITRVPG